MERNLKKLELMLENVKDSYNTFVDSIVTGCEYYSDKNDYICEQLIDYIESNPEADSSMILDKYSEIIGIPYCGDNGKWYRWGVEISEDEARRIANEEYADE